MKVPTYVSSTGNLPFVCLVFTLEFTIFRLWWMLCFCRWSLAPGTHSQCLRVMAANGSCMAESLPWPCPIWKFTDSAKVTTSL